MVPGLGHVCEGGGFPTPTDQRYAIARTLVPYLRQGPKRVPSTADSA